MKNDYIIFSVDSFFHLNNMIKLREERYNSVYRKSKISKVYNNPLDKYEFNIDTKNYTLDIKTQALKKIFNDYMNLDSKLQDNPNVGIGKPKTKFQKILEKLREKNKEKLIKRKEKLIALKKKQIKVKEKSESKANKEKEEIGVKESKKGGNTQKGQEEKKKIRNV